MIRVLALIVLMVVPQVSNAFRCQPPPPPARARAAAAAVFEGKVVSIVATKDGKYNRVTFQLNRSYKGKASGESVVLTPSNIGPAGYPFEKGKSYLVYALKGNLGLFTNVCTRTKPVDQAEEEILLFKTTAASPQDGIPPIPTPNGGVKVAMSKIDKAGKTDVTKQLQQVLDSLAPAGGTLELPAGKYRVAGILTIPVGVTLQGAVNSPQYIAPLTGTVVMATGGRDKEDASSLFEMGSSTAVRGITVFYPDQKPRDIHPYPFTFHLFGGDNTVENITLINSYNGIRVGPENNVRHRIRSVYGCALRRGITVDSCTDIGRIENVQFHCHWWSDKSIGGDWEPVFEYMWKNLEAFVFARTDWEYVNNTFVFPVNIGYHFIASEKGACNGQFTGNGSDASQKCVVVDQLQPMGLLITGGQFVAFTGNDPIEVVINKSNVGSVRMVNCAFWGPAKQNVVMLSPAFLSLSDCFLASDGKGRALIEADNGRLQVRGCSFATLETSIKLIKGVTHAIITENNGANGVRIDNQIGDAAIMANNEPAK